MCCYEEAEVVLFVLYQLQSSWQHFCFYQPDGSAWKKNNHSFCLISKTANTSPPMRYLSNPSCNTWLQTSVMRDLWHCYYADYVYTCSNQLKWLKTPVMLFAWVFYSHVITTVILDGPKYSFCSFKLWLKLSILIHWIYSFLFLTQFGD